MTIDEYIFSQPEEIQDILFSIRKVIEESIPDAEERMSWQMPTWWRRRNLIHFAAQKKHVGIYPGPDAVLEFTKEFDEKKYKHSKGAVQFPYDCVDLDLIRRIAEWCEKNG